MQKIITDGKYFSPKDSLECGQIFREEPYGKGYKVFSLDKACYVYSDGENTVIETDEATYFSDFFDLERDYSEIYKAALTYGDEFLAKAAEMGKGVRIFKQNGIETLFSFIISQNNHIPRIKSIISRLCESLGDKREFMGAEYYTFPLLDKLANKDESFYSSIGLGYRAKYFTAVAAELVKNGTERFSNMETRELKRELMSLLGVGEKVANCVLLFGFNRTESFPVDTWIEKIYREDLHGELTERSRITAVLEDLYKNNSGYFQQYMFHYKRNILRNGNTNN